MTRPTPSPRLGRIIKALIIISFARSSPAEQTCESMYVPEPIVFSRPGDLILAHLAQLSYSSGDSACDLPRFTGSQSRPAMVYGDLLAYAISKINNDDWILPNVTLGFTVVDGCGSWKVNLARVWTLLLDNCHGGRNLDGRRGIEDGGQGRGKIESEDEDQETEDGEQGGVDGGQGSGEGGQGSEDGGQGSENGEQGSEDGGQGTEDGGQGTEDGGQGTEDGGQGTEDGGQGTVDGGQGTEDGGQGTVDGWQGSENGEQGSMDGGHRSGNGKLVGVVGPISSSASVMVSGALGIHRIPLMSVQATSDELSDKSRFEYFQRVVPPDRYQTDALLDILEQYGWTYFSLFFEEGSYGENLAKQITRKSAARGLCIGYSMMGTIYSTPQDYRDAVTKIAENQNNRVIVTFQLDHFDMLLVAMRDLGLLSHFVLLGSDGICYKKQERPVQPIGILCLSFPFITVDGFAEYYADLEPFSESSSPWLPKVWEEYLDCSWTNTSMKHCQGLSLNKEDLIIRSTIPGKVYDAAFAFAHGLHQLILDKCPEVFLKIGKAADCVDTEELLGYIRGVRFVGLTGKIQFDAQGDMLSGYSILQMIRNEQGEAVLKDVGEWFYTDDGESVLEFMPGATTFEMFHGTNSSGVDISEGSEDIEDSEGPKDRDGSEDSEGSGGTEGSEDTEDGIPISVCSLPCGAREYYHYEENMCCWKCKTCRNNEFVANHTECIVCPDYTWPDDDTALTCHEIPVTTLGTDHPIGISILVTGAAGCFFSILVMVIMIVKRESRLVKACSRELSAISLLGTLLASATSFLFVLYPTDAVCTSRRLLFHVSVSMIFTPILAKTSRVYRIFSSARKSQVRPRFISPKAQLVITGMLLLAQMVLVAVTTLVDGPRGALHMPVPTVAYVEQHCTQALWPFLVPLAFNILILMACAGLGFLTRKLPENFNESWFIFLSVAGTLLMWALMLPTYFTAFYAFLRATVLAFCLLFNVFLTLSCQYGPKMYALLLVREENIVFGTLANTTQVSAIN